MDLVEYLQSKGIEVKSGGSSQIHTTCFFCDEDPSRPGRLYFNNDRDSDKWGLYTCLTGDTVVVTRDGKFPIRDLVGQTVPLLAVRGKGKFTSWIDSPIKYFGEQETFEVTLKRNTVIKKIRATADHRWMVQKKGNWKTEVLTKNLCRKDRLSWVKPQSIFHRGTKINSHGVVRGFIFGDGTTSPYHSVARFFPPKDNALKPFFPANAEFWQSQTYTHYEHTGYPRFYKKELPPLEEAGSYLAGWLAGYFAADGNYTSTSACPKLNSAVKENLEFCETLCMILGIRTFGITHQVRKGKGKEPTKIYGLVLAAEDLSEEFFLIESHRQRYVDWRDNGKSKFTRFSWRVESVVPTGEVEPVFCAVVPEAGNFTLDGHILTGNCFLCHTKGGLNSLRKHFGDPPVDDKPSYRQLHILNAATKYYQECLALNAEAYTYLVTERGLTDETIERLALGWADGGVLNYLTGLGYSTEEIRETGLVNAHGFDFFQEKITIPYFEFGSVVTIRGKQIGGKYMSLPGSTAMLYGVDSARGATTVVNTAGEFDCAIMQQFGFAAIGTPGENIWKPEWTRFLDEAQRVYIVFDNDDAGKAGAEKVAKELGPKSRVVEMPKAHSGQKKIDITEWVVNHSKTKESFDWLFSKAKGGLLVSVQEAYDRWLEIEGNPDLVGLDFNIPEIDATLAHGLTPGQVVVLLARTNTGKSLMTFNILHRMKMVKPDIKVLLLSLEQTRNEWFERAHRINNFYNPGSSQVDTVHYWKDNIYLVDKNRVSESELEVIVDQYKYEMGCEPDLVVIDYLGYYARSFKGEEYARVTAAIMGLKAIAKEHGFVIFAPHQANRNGTIGQALEMSSGRGGGTVEETADMLISLVNPDQTPGIEKADEKRELHMTVLKSRDGGVNTKVKLQLAPLTLAIVPITDPLYERALKEKQYAWAGDTFEQAVHRHITGETSI